MTDAGHNSLIPFDADEMRQWSKYSETAVKLKAKWADKEVTEKNSSELAGDIDKLKKQFTEIENARKDRKAPFIEQGKAIDAEYGIVKKDVETAGVELKSTLTAFIRKAEEEERKRRAAEAAKAAEEARKAREEARKKEAEIAAQDRAVRAKEAREAIAKRREADAAEKTAQKAEKRAESEVRTKVTSKGGGRAMSLRTCRSVEVFDMETAFFHFCDAPELHDCLVSLGNRAVRAAGFNADDGLPGYKIIETRG